MTTGPMHLLPAVDIKAGAVFQNIDSGGKVAEFFPGEVRSRASDTVLHLKTAAEGASDDH